MRARLHRYATPRHASEYLLHGLIPTRLRRFRFQEVAPGARAGGICSGFDAPGNWTASLGVRWDHFADSQDQRNTARSRIQYQTGPRVWVAGGVDYGSGLPFSYAGTYLDAVAQYGQQVVDRLDFERGRVRPSRSINAALGADLYKSENLILRFQVQGQNLNDRLNVLDFQGLFSGNAIGPLHSCFARLTASF